MQRLFLCGKNFKKNPKSEWDFRKTKILCKILSLPVDPGGCAVFPAKAELGFVERNLFLSSGLSQNPKVLKTQHFWANNGNSELNSQFCSPKFGIKQEIPLIFFIYQGGKISFHFHILVLITGKLHLIFMGMFHPASDHWH